MRRVHGVVSLIVTIASSGATQGVPPAMRSEVPQPPGWVAFDADVVKVVAGSPDVIRGRYFRGEDGSDRLESGPGDVVVVSIRNIAKSTLYVSSPKTGWVSQPMALPDGQWRPPRYYREHPALSAIDEPLDGFRVFRWVTAGGDEDLLAPDLNFFALRKKSGDGTTTEYSNVVVRPQPPELFEPPPGVPVRHVTTPGGIVASTPESAENTPGRPCRTCPAPAHPALR